MLVLDGLTAFEYWMTPFAPDDPPHTGASNALLTTFESPSCREITHRMDRIEGTKGELQLLVRSPNERRTSPWISCSTWGSRPLPPGSLVEISEQLSVISPELCAVRLARLLPPLRFFRALFDLLGIYARSTSSHLELVDRNPVTTVDRISTYLDNAGSLPGAALTRRALRWAVEGSASPRETTMDVELAMPTRYGGEGLLHFEANMPIHLSASASGLTQRSYLVGDALWEDRKLVLEYNSNKHHDTPEQLEMDFEKITALQHMGYLVIPISTRQFTDYDVFKNVVVTIRKHLGQRDRYAEEVYTKRLAAHQQLLADESEQRAASNLDETVRWQYISSLM